MFKKVLVQTKRSFEMIILLMIATFLIIGIVVYLYKPTYSVFIDGEQVGYTENKTNLQKKINAYIENGDGDNENVAFVQVDKMPEYELCLLKKDIVLNDDEIFENIKNDGITYYRYYAILEDQEEKSYVKTFEEAENIVNSLKEKNSTNINNISIIEKYETELKDFTSTEQVVAQLYKEPFKVATQNAVVRTTGTVDTSLTASGGKPSLGITLIRPISGVITSRFGAGSSIRRSRHTGLDIGASIGTPIAAAATGTVSFSGKKGSFGNLIVINHGNGVQTYYAHCNKLYYSAGDIVKQGQIIATVGTTGNSTGPHLHLEVRVNGVAYNPQNYVY